MGTRTGTVWTCGQVEGVATPSQEPHYYPPCLLRLSMSSLTQGKRFSPLGMVLIGETEFIKSENNHYHNKLGSFILRTEKQINICQGLGVDYQRIWKVMGSSS